MTKHPTPVVPRVLPVKTGAINIDKFILEVDSIKSLTTVFREVNHLLSLLPEEELEEASLDDGVWYIYTKNKAALEYAWKCDLLCPFTTAMCTLVDTYAEENCRECVDEILDEQLEKNLSINLLGSGLHVVFED